MKKPTLLSDAKASKPENKKDTKKTKFHLAKKIFKS